MTIFSDLSNEFRIVDYSPSHSQFLLRSPINSSRDYNIDIIFKAIDFLVIPNFINGLEISLYEPKEDEKYLVENFELKDTYGYRVFSLKSSEGKIYFIKAMAFGVFHNKLKTPASSLGRYDWGCLGENILWYSTKYPDLIQNLLD